MKKATIIRNVELARKAQNPHLSLQQHLHLHRYQPDLYTPTGHLPAGQQAGTAATAAAAGPVGLYALSQQQPIRIRGKRLADCVEALIGAVYLSATAAAAGGSAAAALGCGSGSGGLPVSEAGLKAAAEFCEAADILPKGVWCPDDVGWDGLRLFLVTLGLDLLMAHFWSGAGDCCSDVEWCALAQLSIPCYHDMLSVQELSPGQGHRMYGVMWFKAACFLSYLMTVRPS